jgi:hypothetical protein
MRTELPSVAYQEVGSVSITPGHWPIAGFSFVYRLANLRVSRLGALLGTSLLFYLV